jgi:hypothetical protein
MNGFYEQLIAALKAGGYWLKGPGKGSHEKWTNGRVVLIVPFNCYSRHTANAVLKEAGLPTRLR